jgi:hypothetical protein
MIGVFVSYRREDAAGHAGRLFDALCERFGESAVFMDVDLEPGVEFWKRIHEVIAGCSVILVVIGEQWASISRDGRRRLDDPDDFVVREIATALEQGRLVIPVLVQRASMPDARTLPQPIAKLAELNAIELSDIGWRADVQRLLARIAKELEQAQTRDGAAAPPRKQSSFVDVLPDDWTRPPHKPRRWPFRQRSADT